MSPCVTPSVSVTSSHLPHQIPPSLHRRIPATSVSNLVSRQLALNKGFDDGVSGGRGGGRGERVGWDWDGEEELLLENGEYLHYMRTECSKVV